MKGYDLAVFNISVHALQLNNSHLLCHNNLTLYSRNHSTKEKPVFIIN